MIRKSMMAKAAVTAASAALLALGATAGSASANPNAGYVGPGETNNTHAVWCVQKLIDDSPAPAYTAQDGVFGPSTEAAIKTFQTWARQHGWGTASDGDVGPATGDALLGSFSDYYDGYCYTYLPTSY